MRNPLKYVVFVAVLLAVVACQPVASVPQSAESGAAAPATEAALSPSTAQSYTSPAGFSMQIPASWAGHYAVKELTPDEVVALAPTAQSVTQFLYIPAEAGGAPEPVMTIFGYTREAWEAASGEAGSPIGKEVAEGNGLVFVAATPQSNPYSIDSPNTAPFEAMVMSDLEAASTLVITE